VILHWGDRNGTDITPISVTSKYDDGFSASVEYVRKEDGAIEWKCTKEDDGRRISGDEVSTLIRNTLGVLQQSAPAGVRSRDILRALSEQDVPKRTAIRHLGKLCAEGKMVRKVEPNGSVSYVLSGV
jgi:hypothetical protein